MGIIEVDTSRCQIYIQSHFFLYGNALSETIRADMQEEMNTLWNQPRALVWLHSTPYLVNFQVEVFLKSTLVENEVLTNTHPRNNYFRVEEFVKGNISFVDGIGCNTGMFKLENLYKGSTTASHEFGHTLGLVHPSDLDIRGKGKPGIMYPRGTLVDPMYQYNPSARAGHDGGTLNPIHRMVQPNDIELLGLAEKIQRKQSVLGAFSSRYHEAHIAEQD